MRRNLIKFLQEFTLPLATFFPCCPLFRTMWLTGPPTSRQPSIHSLPPATEVAVRASGKCQIRKDIFFNTLSHGPMSANKRRAGTNWKVSSTCPFRAEVRSAGLLTSSSVWVIISLPSGLPMPQRKKNRNKVKKINYLTSGRRPLTGLSLEVRHFTTRYFQVSLKYFGLDSDSRERMEQFTIANKTVISTPPPSLLNPPTPKHKGILP